MSTLEVEADVSESSISRLRIGQPAEIGMDAIPGERFAGEIARMVPTIDRAKATRLVKIKFMARDPRILPDMSAKVVFLDRQLSDAERKPIIAVNRQAVAQIDGRQWVYLIEGDRVKRIEIALSVDAAAGKSAASSAAAGAAELIPVTNLKPGQRVVIRPGALKDGQRIKIVAQ
jgi:hypothetical protein